MRDRALDEPAALIYCPFPALLYRPSWAGQRRTFERVKAALRLPCQSAWGRCPKRKPLEPESASGDPNVWCASRPKSTYRVAARSHRRRASACPGTGVLRGSCSCVGLDMLHNDDHLPVRALCDRVPDGQAIGGKVETIGTWQRIWLGKRVSKRGDRLVEQVKDRPVGGVPEWLRQPVKLVPGPVREPQDRVTH